VNQVFRNQVIGSLLLQPQRLDRAVNVSSLDDLANDVLSLLARVGTNPTLGPGLLEALNEAVDDVVVHMRDQAGARLDTARERLRAWVKSVTEPFGDLTTIGSDAQGPELAAQLVEQILAKLAGATQKLTINALRDRVGELFDIVENDLGLTNTFIQEQVWAFLDGIHKRLTTMPPALDERSRAIWTDMASILRRLKRHLQGVFTFPAFDADRIADDLFALLGRNGAGRVAEQAACVSQALSDTVRAGGTLMDLVPLSSFTTGSIGAAEPAPEAKEKYCWYASWVLQGKPKGWWSYVPIVSLVAPAILNEDVWVSAARDQVRWGEYVLHNGKELTWDKALGYDGQIRKLYSDSKQTTPSKGKEDKVFHKFYGYTFGKRLDAEFMEEFARHSSWICDYMVALLHLIPYLSLKKGDWLANSLNAGIKIGEGTFKLANKGPYGWWLERKAGEKARWDFFLKETPLSVVATVGGALEGMHWNASSGSRFMFYLTQVLSDSLKTVQYRIGMSTVRDFLLSLLTLWNHGGPVSPESSPSNSVRPFWPAGVPDTRPDNRLEVDGFVDPLVALMVTLLLIKNIPREDYAYPGADGDATAKLLLLWDLLGGIGVGLGFGFVWTMVAEIIAWAGDWSLLGWKTLDSMSRAVDPVRFLVAYYLSKEGDTDGGKYNPLGAAFAGYPDPATSPYRLPFARDWARRCGQGNQGMWSHHHLGSSQVYAYDFGLDAGEQVLASRSGTVVDYRDSIPETRLLNETDWNFITIRHDRDDAGNYTTAPNPDHDKGPGGAQVTTYAVYGHGLEEGVRQVFGSRGIAAADIIGQRVMRGDPIMLTGSVGKSFHNHVHMHVRAGPAPPATPPGPGAGAVGSGSLTPGTIPFVFREVINPWVFPFSFPPDGVPQARTYYTSENG